MKNIKIYKKTLSLLTATAISLTLSSCSRKKTITEQEKTTFKEQIETSNCLHLSIQIGNEYETFKECEGYDLHIKSINHSDCHYTISKNDEIYLTGATKEINYFTVNHNQNESENKAIQKTKTKK